MTITIEVAANGFIVRIERFGYVEDVMLFPKFGEASTWIDQQLEEYNKDK